MVGRANPGRPTVCRPGQRVNSFACERDSILERQGSTPPQTGIPGQHRQPAGEQQRRPRLRDLCRASPRRRRGRGKVVKNDQSRRAGRIARRSAHSGRCPSTAGHSLRRGRTTKHETIIGRAALPLLYHRRHIPRNPPLSRRDGRQSAERVAGTGAGGPAYSFIPG